MTRRYEKRDKPVTISSANPSASDVRSPLLPLYLNGSTATQKPSSVTRARRARPTRTGSTRGRWSSTRQRHLSREVAAFIGDITRGLDALTRILLQAASNQAREVGRQIAAQFGDERRRVAQDRRRQFGRRRTREGTFTAGHLVEKDAEREDVAAVIHGPARDLLRRHVGRRTHHHAMFGVPG